MTLFGETLRYWKTALVDSFDRAVAAIGLNRRSAIRTIASIAIGLMFVWYQSPQDLGWEWLKSWYTILYPLLTGVLIFFLPSLLSYPVRRERKLIDENNAQRARLQDQILQLTEHANSSTRRAEIIRKLGELVRRGATLRDARDYDETSHMAWREEVQNACSDPGFVSIGEDIRNIPYAFPGAERQTRWRAVIGAEVEKLRLSITAQRTR